MVAGATGSRYSLSFTSGALLSTEAALIAPIYLRERDWGETRDRAVNDNVLQSRAASSRTRTLRAVLTRLQQLTDVELEIVASGSSSERGHLLWAAACRAFDLIGEFAEEVLRERFLTLAETLTYEHFDSFYRTKAAWHDELTEISESTYKKLRQVLFRMMTEAGLVTDGGRIEPVLLSTRVRECLRDRDPSDIRFFPVREVQS